MRILVKEHGSIISDLAFERRPIPVGSNPDSAVHLPDMRISRTHVRLNPAHDGGWIVETLDPAARTMVNGHVLRNNLKISNGDQITIEDFTLNIYFDLDERNADSRGVAEIGVAGPAVTAPAPEHSLPAGAVSRGARETLLMTPTQLEDWVRFAMELGGLRDLSAVMDATVDELLKRFKARAVWIGLRKSGRGPLDCAQGRDCRGQSFERPLLYEALRLRCMDRGLAVWVPVLSNEPTGSLMAAPITSASGRLGFIYLDSKKDGELLVERDFDHLVALSTVVASQLERVMREQVRWQKELSGAENSIVHAIQARMDPRLVPEWPELQVAAHCRPGQENAGDVFDVMQVRGGAAAFLLGHVAGPATATVTALIEARTAFRMAVLHTDIPHVMLQELNWLLCARSAEVRIQLAVVMVDPANGALLHSIAGPSCGVVIGQSGCPRRLESGGAAVLGASADSTYQTRKGLLGKNELLALFSPGIATIQNAQGQALGEEALLESLCDGFGIAARKALEETFSDLSSYCGEGYQPDDATLLLARRL